MKCYMCGRDRIWLGIFHLSLPVPVYICPKCDRRRNGND